MTTKTFSLTVRRVFIVICLISLLSMVLETFCITAIDPIAKSRVFLMAFVVFGVLSLYMKFYSLTKERDKKWKRVTLAFFYLLCLIMALNLIVTVVIQFYPIIMPYLPNFNSTCVNRKILSQALVMIPCAIILVVSGVLLSGKWLEEGFL